MPAAVITPPVIWVPMRVPIVAYQVVTSGGLVANSSDLRGFGRIAGVVRTGAAVGRQAEVMQVGELINTGWSWLNQGDPLYLFGALISLRMPVSGFLIQLGWVKDSMTMFVDPQIPILL